MTTEKKAAEGMGTEEYKEIPADVLLEELTALVEDLEQQEHPLEETFRRYQRGLTMVQALNEKVDRIEKQMQILEAGSGGEE